MTTAVIGHRLSCRYVNKWVTQCRHDYWWARM